MKEKKQTNKRNGLQEDVQCAMTTAGKQIVHSKKSDNAVKIYIVQVIDLHNIRKLNKVNSESSTSRNNWTMKLNGKR